MELLIASNTVPEESRDVMPASGTPGWATDGNAASSIPATNAPASHYNMMMAEILQPILDAGLTPDGTNWGQLSAAIKLLAATVLTQTLPWTLIDTTQAVTVPSWAKHVEIRMRGASGGGANCQASSVSGNWCGGGGGGGGFAWGTYPVTAGDTLTFTIAAGGAAQMPGGTSSVVNGAGSTLISITGGSGSSFIAAGISPGGAGGVPTGGTLQNLTGDYGKDGQAGTYGSLNGNGGVGENGCGAGRAANGGGSLLNATGFGAGGAGAYDTTFSNKLIAGGTGYQAAAWIRFLPN